MRPLHTTYHRRRWSGGCSGSSLSDGSHVVVGIRPLGRMHQPRLRQAARCLPFVRPRRDRASTIRQDRHVRRMHRILLQTGMHLHQKHTTSFLTQITRHEARGAHWLRRQLRAGRSTSQSSAASIDEAERRGSRQTSGHGRPRVQRGSEKLPYGEDEEDERQPHHQVGDRVKRGVVQ